MPNPIPDQVAAMLDSGHAVGDTVYLRCKVIAKSGLPDQREYTVQVDDGKEHAVAVTVPADLVTSAPGQ